MFTDSNNQVIDDDDEYGPDCEDTASENSNEEGSITGVEDDNEDNDRHLVNDTKESNQDQHSNKEDDGELQNLSDVQNLRDPEEDYVAVPSEVKPKRSPEEGSHKDAPISEKYDNKYIIDQIGDQTREQATANADIPKPDTNEFTGVRRKDDVGSITGVGTVEEDDPTATYEVEAELEKKMDKDFGPRGQTGLRARRDKSKPKEGTELKKRAVQKPRNIISPREYGELHACMHMQEQHAILHSSLLNQYGVKKGIELYKEEGDEAVLKELRQIHSKKSIILIQPK